MVDLLVNRLLFVWNRNEPHWDHNGKVGKRWILRLNMPRKKRSIQRGSTLRNIVSGRFFKIVKVEMKDVVGEQRKVFTLRHQETGDELTRTAEYVMYQFEHILA